MNNGPMSGLPSLLYARSSYNKGPAGVKCNMPVSKQSSPRRLFLPPRSFFDPAWLGTSKLTNCDGPATRPKAQVPNKSYTLPNSNRDKLLSATKVYLAMESFGPVGPGHSPPAPDVLQVFAFLSLAYFTSLPVSLPLFLSLSLSLSVSLSLSHLLCSSFRRKR